MVRTAGWPKLGVKRIAMSARFKAGTSTSPIAITPAVADMVNSQKNVWSERTVSRPGVPSRVNGMMRSTVIVMTFERTGLHAAAKKWRRELRSADPIAVSP